MHGTGSIQTWPRVGNPSRYVLRIGPGPWLRYRRIASRTTSPRGNDSPSLGFDSFVIRRHTGRRPSGDFCPDPHTDATSGSVGTNSDQPILDVPRDYDYGYNYTNTNADNVAHAHTYTHRHIHIDRHAHIDRHTHTNRHTDDHLYSHTDSDSNTFANVYFHANQCSRTTH